MTPPTDVSVPAAKATRREWLGLAVLTLPCLLYSMDLNVLNLAIPQLAVDLRPSASEMLWIVDIYGFLLAGFLITMGTLGDRIGRRRLLMIGATAFGAASVLAAFSTSAGMLIFSRGLLGIAAATLAPSTLSLIRNMFLDARQRSVAIGIWVSCFAVGGALGPVVGGVLLEHFWWGSVFLIAVPIMALLLVLAPVLLPEFRDPDAGALDLPSSALATLAVLATIYGMKRIAEHGPDGTAGAAVIAGLAIGALFVRRQNRLANPMIDLGLLRSRLFGAALGVNIISTFAAFGSFLLIPQYLQLVLAMSPLEAGLWLVPTGLVFIVGALLAPVLARKLTPRRVLIWGFLVTAVGYGVLTQISAGGGLWTLMTGLLILCAGIAPMGTVTTDLIMAAAPAEKAGAASGISETSFEFGAALGVAVLGSIAMFVYRVHLAASVPQGVSAEVIDAASDTLGGAVAAANGVRSEVGLALLETARGAFTSSVEATALVCAILSIAAAIMCSQVMRSEPKAA